MKKKILHLMMITEKLFFIFLGDTQYITIN